MRKIANSIRKGIFAIIFLFLCVQFTADSQTIAFFMRLSFSDDCDGGRIQSFAPSEKDGTLIQSPLYLEESVFNQLSGTEISSYCLCASESLPYTTKDIFLMRASIGYYNPLENNTYEGDLKISKKCRKEAGIENTR